MNEKYAQELNRAKIFFTCGSALRYPLLKFYEAPACRTLLLAEPNQDIFDLGFKDGTHFIACEVEDFYDKAKYYLQNKKKGSVSQTTATVSFIHSIPIMRVHKK